MNGPLLWPNAIPWWEAFWALSAGRQISLGFGASVEQPIAYSEISAYARDNPAVGDMRVTTRLIQALDRAFREVMAQRRTKAAPAKPGLILPSE